MCTVSYPGTLIHTVGFHHRYSHIHHLSRMTGHPLQAGFFAFAILAVMAAIPVASDSAAVSGLPVLNDIFVSPDMATAVSTQSGTRQAPY